MATIHGKDKRAWRDPTLWRMEDLWEKGISLRDKVGDLGMLEHVEELGRFDPLLPHYLIQFQFGEVMSRPNLDLRTRLLCLISAGLMARRENVVEGAMNGFLDLGGDQQEIIETVIQTGSEGFSMWIVGATIGLKVFRERGLVPAADDDQEGGSAWENPLWKKEDLYEKGVKIRTEDMGVSMDLWDEHGRLDLLFPLYVTQFRFGELEGRQGLDMKTRQLCAFAQFLEGRFEHASEVFLRGSLSAGATPEECIEVFLMIGVFFGISRWTLGSRVCRAVFDDLGLMGR